MSTDTHARFFARVPSIVKGPPLSEEPGLGALTLPGFLREVTTRFADREALVLRTEQGAERWTYALLWERALEVARALVACGVGRDSRVGVLMTNRPQWLAAVFGTGLAGGVAVTLSTFSTPPELRYLLQASCVSVLLFEHTVLKKDFATVLRELEPQIRTARAGQLASATFPFLRHLAAVGEGSYEDAIESWPGFLARGKATSRALVEARAATVRPSDAGGLFFSSGSTSQPKGILSSHRAIAIQCWRWRRLFALQDDVRCWTSNGFFWSGNFAMALGATLSSGGSLVLQPTFVATEALELMQAERVTLPIAWPHQWAQLEAAPSWKQVDLSSLRYVESSRFATSQPTISTTWRDPKWTYGNTETFTVSCAFPSDTPAEVAGKSHGVPLSGMTVKIIDAETGAVQSRGERGEIAVKGPTLMLGYIGVPMDETLDEEGFFATGDGGYIDERGRLVWEGRLTDIIKTGGANVSPVEIDAILATYPGVKIARTVGIPHDTLGEMVVACVVPQGGLALQEADIRDFLKERLASYKVPRRVLFFRDDEIALTGSAKVKSGMLRTLVAGRLSVRT